MEFQEYGHSKFDQTDDTEKEFDEGDEEAERVILFYDSVKSRLNPEIRDSLDEVAAAVESSYDPDKEDWTDLLSQLDILITKFDNADDGDELDELQTDSEDEVGRILSKAKKLKIA